MDGGTITGSTAEPGEGGGISVVWYVMSILSACALLVLSIMGKKHLNIQK